MIIHFTRVQLFSLKTLSFIVGYEKVVKKLIENGAVVNTIDDNGVAPIHLAAGGGKKEGHSMTS